MTSVISVFRLLNDQVVAEIDRGRTSDQRALDGIYTDILEREGPTAVMEQALLHVPQRSRGQWWCTAPQCQHDRPCEWPCKWIIRAWKAHRRIAQTSAAMSESLEECDPHREDDSNAPA